MTKRSNWSIPYFIFLVLFVVLPLVLVIVYAFQDNEGGFTLANIPSRPSPFRWRSQ